MSDSVSRTAVILVHGSWHGGWCWGLVEPYLRRSGLMTFAIDLPGHGLSARLPSSFLERPLDSSAFSSEPSPLASIGIDAYSDAVISAADDAISSGAQKVVVVSHSMGGVPATFAAARAPEKFNRLIYVSALLPTPKKPAGAYLELEEQRDNADLRKTFVADPAVIGALRIDPRSSDIGYLSDLKVALAADVDDSLLTTVRHLLTPDAPASIYGETVEFPSSFGDIKRVYIRCANDCTVLPSTGSAIVDDLNAAGFETSLVDLPSSHEAMFSVPEQLADLIISHA